MTAGYAPISIGTESDGSLIVPAGRGALYTLKPTMSIVSQEGIVPITRLFDSAGPITKGVKDLAILMDVLVEHNSTQVPQGGYVSAVTGKWDGLRIGTLDPNVWEFPTVARKSEPSAEKQMVRSETNYSSFCSQSAERGNVSSIQEDPDAYRQLS